MRSWHLAMNLSMTIQYVGKAQGQVIEQSTFDSHSLEMRNSIMVFGTVYGRNRQKME